MKTKTYEKLRAAIETMPVIDCHEHTLGPASYPKYREPIASLIQGYVLSDLWAAGAEPDNAMLNDPGVPTERKWPAFERYWKRTEHTAYARVTKWILKNEYGIEQVTLKNLQSMAGRLLDLSDPKAYRAYLEKHGIRCRICNIWPDWSKVLSGAHRWQEYDRVMIGLPDYHDVRSAGAAYNLTLRNGRRPTSLDEFLEICFEQFRKFKELGIIGMKDQCAYGRGIAFENPSRAEAEALFNRVMADQRQTLGWPEAKPLDDFLFHEFMRMARKLEFPVQIHTGHMAGIRNDIAKTNAVLFTKILELHQEVRFDLFHGNWPYAGEWLYLAKNYPNVNLDCCWLHIIDPAYARRVLADAVGAVPHGKIHGFGGDYGDSIEYAAGHLAIARDNIAAALAGLVDDGWLGADEALQIARDWLFNNPNEFYRLGFKSI